MAFAFFAEAWKQRIGDSCRENLRPKAKGDSVDHATFEYDKATRYLKKTVKHEKRTRDARKHTS